MTDPVTGFPFITVDEVVRRLHVPTAGSPFSPANRVVQWLAAKGCDATIETPTGKAFLWDDFIQCFAPR